MAWDSIRLEYSSEIPVMAPTTLNNDIYDTILEGLDKRKDVTSFMLSSKLFYSLGFDRLLRMGVLLENDQQMVSFCSSMKRCFLDVAKNAGQLRDLAISIKPPMESSRKRWTLQGAPFLIPVLGCLTNLRNLEISYCESLLCCDDQLVEAFAALTTLQVLRISGFGQKTHSMVATLRSHLRAAHIDCIYHTSASPAHSDGPCIADTLFMLREHQNTLEQADIRIGDAITWSRKQELHTANYVFPHVHELRLTGCCGFNGGRKAMEIAFPNVRRLYLHWENAPEAIQEEESRPRLDNDDGSRNMVEPNPWEKLEHVCADVDSLYVHALKCSVDRLDVTFWDFKDLDNVDIGHLCTSLKDMRPRRLVLRWDKFDVDEHEACTLLKSYVEQLLNGLEQPAINAMTHIGLDFGITSFQVDIQAHQYMDAFSLLLDSLPRVRFFSVRLRQDAQLTAEQNVTHEVYSDSASSNEELSAWVAQRAAASQSLEFLSFTVLDRPAYRRISRGRSQLLQVDVDRPNDGMRHVAAEGMLM
ncbi:hypothetical protein VTO73DRAFT_4494 [Trametes versicolor]